MAKIVYQSGEKCSLPPPRLADSYPSESKPGYSEFILGDSEIRRERQLSRAGGPRQKRSVSLFLGALLAFAVQAFTAPDNLAHPSIDLSIYRRAIHVGWVVKDLDRVTNYWERLGLKNIQRVGVHEAPNRVYRGNKIRLTRKTAWGNIGGVLIEWIEPVEGENASVEFLRKHGDGIHHLAYAVRSSRQLDEQIKYFKDRGVEAVEEGSWQGTRGQGRLAYLDLAAPGGGLAIELVYDPDSPPPDQHTDSHNDYPFNRIVQYAFLVRDVKKVAGFYERLGFGGMSIEHNVSVDRNYRGQPGKYEMYLGWWHWSDVTFEWIQPLVGPSVYDEYLKAHGEGLHHLAFDVDDLDRAVALLGSRGAPVSQSGGWINDPGSKGRFAYLDTEPYGGVTIELLWNQPTQR